MEGAHPGVGRGWRWVLPGVGMEGVPLGIGDGVGRRGRDPRDWEMEGNPKEQGMEGTAPGVGDGQGTLGSWGWRGRSQERGMDGGAGDGVETARNGGQKGPPLGWGAEERNPQGWEMTGDPQE